MALWRLAKQQRRLARICVFVSVCALLGLTGCIGDFNSREELLAKLDAAQSDALVEDGDALDPADGLSDVGSDVLPDADAVEVDVADVPDDAIDASDVETDQNDADAADVPLTCPAAPGCPCKDGSKCASGVCLDVIDFQSSFYYKVCALPCTEGQICAKADGAPDAVCAPVDVSPTQKNWVCVPKWETLCDPCQNSESCVTSVQKGAACLNFGAKGNYCGTACSSVGDCASGFDCLAVTSVEGKTLLQCVPQPTAGNSGIGECTCSNVALHKKLSTPCFVPSYDKTGALVGKCSGTRVCDVDALTACSAPKPKDEVCDTFDNDCDGLIDEGTCDDGKQCTTDFCAGAADCTHTTLDGNACDDGSACTTGDVCVQEACTGTAKICAGSACVAMQCDPMDGSCDSALKPDTTPCDDGNACTLGDICLAGNCSGGSLTCDDANPCTNDSCTPKVGCVHDANASLCNDLSACTDFDQCVDSVCIGTAKVGGCDDANPCTDDSCDGGTGCIHLPNSATCSDGNACTLSDFCQNGQCASGVNECTCAQDADCKPKEDGDLCNGTLFCDTSAVPFQCQVKTATIVACVPSNNPCLTTACVPATGSCVDTPVADGTTCDADSNVCTVGDACLTGMCTAGPTKLCDDGNVCTDDACDAKIGCTKTANAAACSDDNACTNSDMCQGTVCVSGSATLCADKNPCTADSCDTVTGACKFAPTTGPCDDGNFCTMGDSCDAATGACQSGSPTQCISATKCATGSCDAATGNCAFAQVVCDDGSPCTNDACVSTTGCVFTPKPRDDNNACTKDSCDIKTGACVNTPLNCDDGNVCTTDTCNSQTGCANTNTADGTVCSGNAKVCAAGACKTPFASPPLAFGGIAAGTAFTCVRAWGVGGENCWGSGQQGQLGDGGGVNRAQPVAVSNLASVLDADCGGAFACAVRGTTNTTRCWGANGSGQLGNNSTTTSNVPVDVVSTGYAPATPVRVTTGNVFACALLTNHRVWCWGDNGHQQLGGGLLAVATQTSKVPALVTNLTNVTAIAAGTAHICAVQGGNVYCWGQNKDGQCGQAGGADVNTPTQVGTLANITAVASGDDFSCALGNGNVWCWGNNQHGQLATGATDGGGGVPVAIGVSNITDLSAGLGHVCARGSNGSVTCWGRNDAGQTGNGNQSDVLVPTAVPGFSGAYRIGAGDLHTCTVRLDGSVWCWGSNTNGALGLNNGSNQPVLVPSQVVGSAPK